MRSALSTFNDRQKWNATHNSRSISRGHCGCGGTHVGSVVSTIRNPSRIGADVSPTSLKLAGQTIAPSLFSRIPMQRRGSRPMAAHSTPVQPILQAIADRVTIHLSCVLSNACSPAGSNNASKRGQALGKVIHERGRISQARGCRV